MILSIQFKISEAFNFRPNWIDFDLLLDYLLENEDVLLEKVKADLQERMLGMIVNVLNQKEQQGWHKKIRLLRNY